MVDHFQEAVDVFFIDEQTRQTENIPRRIVHVNRHFDVTFLAGGHDCLKEILEVCPQLLVIDVGIILEQLVEFCHTLRLPTGERHIIFLGEIQNILRHRVVVILNHTLFIKQRRGTVADLVEQIGTRPIKNRHEIVANDLYTEFAQVADALLVVFNQRIAGRFADLDVIVNVDGFHHVAVESVGVKLLHHLSNFRFLPDLTGHFMMQCPDDAGHAGNLFDVGQLDFIVSFAVPTKTHLHRHRSFLLTG